MHARFLGEDMRTDGVRESPGAKRAGVDELVGKLPTCRPDGLREKAPCGMMGGMVKGIGIDTVEIARMRRLCAGFPNEESGSEPNAFLQRTFTDNERAEAAERHDPASYLAGRFAVKEAAFKAVAHLTESRTFDYRTVETLTGPNGAPRVVPTERLSTVLKSAGASELMVSITNEAGLAIAIVLAQ